MESEALDQLRRRRRPFSPEHAVVFRTAATLITGPLSLFDFCCTPILFNSSLSCGLIKKTKQQFMIILTIIKSLANSARLFLALLLKGDAYVNELSTSDKL